MCAVVGHGYRFFGIRHGGSTQIARPLRDSRLVSTCQLRRGGCVSRLCARGHVPVFVAVGSPHANSVFQNTWPDPRPADAKSAFERLAFGWAVSRGAVDDRRGERHFSRRDEHHDAAHVGCIAGFCSHERRSHGDGHGDGRRTRAPRHRRVSLPHARARGPGVPVHGVCAARSAAGRGRHGPGLALPARVRRVRHRRQQAARGGAAPGDDARARTLAVRGRDPPEAAGRRGVGGLRGRGARDARRGDRRGSDRSGPGRDHGAEPGRARDDPVRVDAR